MKWLNRCVNKFNLQILLLLYFQVSSRGQVVAAGTKTSSSFSLTPTVSWSPEACVTVYCILPDGEVTSDTAHIPINQHDYVLSFNAFYHIILIGAWFSRTCLWLFVCVCFPQVSLSWSTDKAQPGEQGSLAVTAFDPRSQVGIVVMGAHDEAPQADLDLKPEQVWQPFCQSLRV